VAQPLPRLNRRAEAWSPSGPGTRAFREARAHIHLRPPCEAPRWE
jgi:hypothetical protein